MMRKLLWIFLAAFFLRLFFLLTAHHGDLNNNISWGQLLLERGALNYYEGKNWLYSAPNQPPLTILMFGLLIWVYNIIDVLTRFLNDTFLLFPSNFIWFWEVSGKDVLVKLPSILADFGVAFLIYKYFLELKKDKLGLILTCVWLFNPVIWFNSSIWGQTDSIVNLLGLMGIFALLKKNLLKSAIWFTLAVLFKGSLLVFAPVLLFYAFSQRYSLLNLGKALVVSLFLIYFVSWVFHPMLDLPLWIFNLYYKRILPGEIGYLTANAFNFWWLVDSGKTLDSVRFVGLTARVWGFVFTLFGVIYVIYNLKRKFDVRRFWWAFSVVALVSFLFMTRIHERYLYPFFPVGTILVGVSPVFALPYVVISVAHLFNLFHLFPLPWQIDLSLLFSNTYFISSLSVLNCFLLLWIIKIGKKYT